MKAKLGWHGRIVRRSRATGDIHLVLAAENKIGESILVTYKCKRFVSRGIEDILSNVKRFWINFSTLVELSSVKKSRKCTMS